MIIDQQTPTTPTKSYAPRRRRYSIGSDIHSAQGKAHVRVFSFLLLVMLIGLMLAGCNTAQPAPIEQATEIAEVAPTDNSEPATQESTVVPESTATSESTNTQTSTDIPEPTATLVPTDTPEPTATLVPPTDTPEPTATNTLVPTITPSHTATEIAIPMVGLKEADFENINLRSGPSTDYPVLGQFNRADLTELLGQNETKDWLQIDLDADGEMEWVFADLIMVMGNLDDVPVVETPLPPPPTETPDPTFVSLIDLTAEPIEMEVVETEEVSITEPESATENETENQAPPTSEELANDLRCGKDFCVTYQTLMSKAENGGCIGNHSIYITVLQGPPPGQPMDGVVLGDTFNNVEVGSGSHGPGRTEITLWSNSMTLYVKRNMDGTPYTSEESFNFTTLDELIPADALAVAGYCEGNVEKCEWARNHNQVCRGHYSWRVTFHKFD
ncbi:SH3 domain-containing protein [Anaerolineales bacterium HSG6]|nr:SH3 domain-containing protein [Anaerolineales bacterium HSG6]